MELELRKVKPLRLKAKESKTESTDSHWLTCSDSFGFHPGPSPLPPIGRQKPQVMHISNSLIPEYWPNTTENQGRVDPVITNLRSLKYMSMILKVQRLGTLCEFMHKAFSLILK